MNNKADEPARQQALHLSLLRRFMTEHELIELLGKYTWATAGKHRQLLVEVLARFMTPAELDDIIGAYRNARLKYGRAVSEPSSDLIEVTERFLAGSITYDEAVAQAAKVTGKQEGSYQIHRAVAYMARQGRLQLAAAPVVADQGGDDGETN